MARCRREIRHRRGPNGLCPAPAGRPRCRAGPQGGLRLVLGRGRRRVARSHQHGRALSRTRLGRAGRPRGGGRAFSPRGGEGLRLGAVQPGQPACPRRWRAARPGGGLRLVRACRATGPRQVDEPGRALSRRGMGGARRSGRGTRLVSPRRRGRRLPGAVQLRHGTGQPRAGRGRPRLAPPRRRHRHAGLPPQHGEGARAAPASSGRWPSRRSRGAATAARPRTSSPTAAPCPRSPAPTRRGRATGSGSREPPATARRDRCFGGSARAERSRWRASAGPGSGDRVRLLGARTSAGRLVGRASRHRRWVTITEMLDVRRKFSAEPLIAIDSQSR